MKRLALLALVFLLSGPVYALTVDQIEGEVRVAVQDNPTDATRVKYSSAVLLNILNEGQREIVNLVWPLQKSTEYPLIPLTSYYALPSDCIGPYHVLFRDRGSNVTELTEYTETTLYQSFTNWEFTKGAGTPSYFWVSPATQPTNTGGSNWPLRISYIPVPNATSTGVVTAWYYAEAEPLSLQSDIPFSNKRDLYQYHYALVYYAATRIDILEGDDAGAKTYRTLYDNAIVIMKDRLGRIPGYSPGMIGGPPH